MKYILFALSLLSGVYFFIHYPKIPDTILRNILAAVISLFSVLLVVEINAFIRKKNILNSNTTRKLVHIFVGTVFGITWLLFSTNFLTRFIVTLVPLMFVIQFIAIGTGKIKDEQFVASMCRTGNAKELLEGTLYYSVIMVIISLLWFYLPSTGIKNANPTALLILGCLAGGDGFADIIGRKYGGEKKFGLKGSEKTIAGTTAMFIFSFTFSFLLLYFFSFKIPAFNPISLTLPLLVVSVVATLIEALSPKGIDNLTIFAGVSLTVLLLSYFFPFFWPFDFINF